MTLTTEAPKAKVAPVKAMGRSWVPRPRTIWFFVGTVVMMAYCLAPFYWMLVSSLKPGNDILNNDLIPSRISFENFEAVFGPVNNFGYAVRNSVIIALTTTIFALLLAVFAAYAAARLKFRGRRIFLGLVLSASMFPGVAILTPLYDLFSRLGWIDQYQAMIIPDISFALPLGIWTLTNFLADMPWELEEAARVDGCTPLQAFRKVILPVCRPAVITTGLLVFFAAWNEFLISSVVSLTLASSPVTVAIAKFGGSSQFEVPYGTQMAAGVIVTIPLVILVLLFQRRIVQGLTAGSVKG